MRAHIDKLDRQREGMGGGRYGDGGIACQASRTKLRALGKRRIGLPELRAAYLRAHPEAQGAPDLRRLLLDALQALERDGVTELPKQGWDESGSPPLPRTARLRVAASARRARRPYAWLPALAFAADERHPVRRADLQAINAFLLSMREGSVLPVPTRERSLQVFGDEKRLDQLRKGGLALFEGRISLDDLRCYPVAPPLPYETSERTTPGKGDPRAGELSFFRQLPPVESEGSTLRRGGLRWRQRFSAGGRQP